ncbi:unnamed protein product [Rodentolepis nana]|uniref:ANK_REP_REGION domain-containing protein n=1 Tax=Rodentolepis nana TaxID=102285 RepID=A0A158QHP8_RODNA|nr:unnamed protein product [Rodentolepis nana]
MAEHLSTTLQACLRACVRQHAVPSPLPTTMPSFSSQQHGHSPIFPSSSISNSTVTTSNAYQWIGSDLNSGSMATSIRSSLPECSQPFNATFSTSSELRSYSPKSRLNNENNHNRMQPPASPMLQIPPPPPPLNVSSWEEVNQTSGGRFSNSSTDFPSEIPLLHSSSNSQVPDVTFSAKQSTPKRSIDMNWRPLGNCSSGEAERDAEGLCSRVNGDRAIHQSESKGSPQYRYPIQVSQEAKARNLEDAYHDLVQNLVLKRSAANRPERLIDMTFEQLEAEKLLMQRTLLNFESKYGRPTERNDRILLRPVYDRYRCVKRLLAAGASHNCGRNPLTPAHAFAPPDMLESVESLSPLKIHTPNSAIKLTTPHSDFYVSIIGSSSRDSATGREQISLPARSRHTRSSNEGLDYPLIPFTSVTNRCTSVNSSVKPKSTPDEWFGSLGVSRTSGQRTDYPLRHSGNEGNDMAKCRLDQSMHEVLSMVNQGDEEGLDDNETVGRQTPVNEGSPNLSLSPSPLGRSELAPHQRFSKPRQKLLTAQSQTQAHGLGGDNYGYFEESSLRNYQQSLRQSSRHFIQTPMGSLSQRQQQAKPSSPYLQRQSYQVTRSHLTGDDPETGKPLEQAIADYVRKYAQFSVTELQAESDSVKESKKTLQKFLKDYEHDFERKYGRKVEAEDRQPLNPEYMHYKMLKARLASLERLLEARSNRILY